MTGCHRTLHALSYRGGHDEALHRVLQVRLPHTDWPAALAPLLASPLHRPSGSGWRWNTRRTPSSAGRLTSTAQVNYTGRWLPKLWMGCIRTTDSSVIQRRYLNCLGYVASDGRTIVWMTNWRGCVHALSLRYYPIMFGVTEQNHWKFCHDSRTSDRNSNLGPLEYERIFLEECLRSYLTDFMNRTRYLETSESRGWSSIYQASP
jgi:hypothetical protein